ncbi:GNAT family N-acetyltransferase [Fluviicola sp.]|uniref:GNAT family N-acetyltransferase n=1 Tax=Fluviicola sp. TaxID=1917219 RepID=UPI0031CDE8C8
MSEPLKITHNEELQQFEYREGDVLATLTYKFYKKDIAFMHTDVPESLAGKGVASALASAAFEYARKIKKLVMVYCPFVASYVKRHPELKDQIDKQYLG